VTARTAAPSSRAACDQAGAGRAGEEGELLLATQYPLLDIFVSIIEFFILFLWIFLLINIFFDLFRSHDLKGWHKAVWAIFLIILPFIGVLVYLIVRGGGMHERSAQQAKRQDEAFQQYVRQAAHSPGSTSADQLTRLAQLKDQGVLSQEEFDREKAKVLGSA
jgi:hypothetical protein